MAKRGLYRVVLSPAAQRDLRRLSDPYYHRVISTLSSLETDPRPLGSRKVQGQPSTFRIRIGPYRVIYDVFDDQRLIEVLHVLRRTETTYRRLR